MLVHNIGPTRLPETKYLFIDGGYLDKVLSKMAKDFWGVDTIEIDYKKLIGGFNKAFYYNCLPAKSENEPETEYENGLMRKYYFMIS